MFLNPAVDPVRLSTSWLIKANHLAFIRGLISLYIFTSIITILALRAHDKSNPSGHYFSYFTSLTFFGLAFYFAFSAFHSWTFWRRGLPALSHWGVVLQQFQSIFYTTIVVYPYIVTIVFWVLIFDSFVNVEDKWSNVSQHALNSVFSLFELVFARADPLPWIHLLWVIIVLALYLGLAFLTHATEHFWVYTFLDDSRKGGRGLVAGYIIGILVGAVIVFVIVRYLVVLRKWVTETKLGKTGRLETRRGGAGRDAEIGEYQGSKKPTLTVG